MFQDQINERTSLTNHTHPNKISTIHTCHTSSFWLFQIEPNTMTTAQTTLLIGGSNGTATLTAILGDNSNPINQSHILRVATRSGKKYLANDGVTPRTWRCEEKRHLSDLVSADILPTRKIVHVGRPDSVFVYGDGDVEG